MKTSTSYKVFLSKQQSQGCISTVGSVNTSKKHGYQRHYDDANIMSYFIIIQDDDNQCNLAGLSYQKRDNLKITLVTYSEVEKQAQFRIQKLANDDQSAQHAGNTTEKSI